MSDSVYKSIISDMTWSYSRLTTFEDCPYRWLLKYIYECDDEEMFYASYGSFMHGIIEKYYRKELTKDEMLGFFLRNFSGEVRGDRPPGDISAKYVQKGIDYLKSFEPFPYEMVDVERKIDFDLDGIPFTGVIDFIGSKDGEYIIVDNKSRDLKPRSKRSKPTVKDEELDAMLRQLYLYSAAIKREFGKLPSRLCFNCFKAGVFIDEPFIESEYEKTLDWAVKTVREIQNTEEFNPYIEYFPCAYLCGVSGDCCFKQ